MKKGNRGRDGPLWLLLGSLVGLTYGLGQPSLFFPTSFLFRFIYFFHLLCYGVASSVHMQSITLPRLITFNEGSTTRHLKKVKEVVGKTRAATRQGSVESSTRADRVESNAR
jgi:hypothetical protein